MKKITFLVLLICVMSIGCLFLVNNNLSNTNASLNNQLQQQEQMYSGKIDELTVYQEKLVERISLLEENYQKLQIAYDELKAAYDQYLLDSTLEREQLQTTVSSLNATIVELEQNSDVDAETITALRSEVSTLETSLENQTTTANQLQATVTQQEATIAELNATIDELIADLNSDLTKIEFYQDVISGEVTEIKESDLEGITTIRPYAFSYCDSLESVSLNDGITEIGESAFQACSNLKNADLSNSLSKINKKLFSDCSKLEIINLPDGVVEIGENAFYFCKMLSNLNLPKNIEIIGDCSFMYANLLELDFGNYLKLTNIGSKAFANNNSLETVVNFPSSLNEVSLSAFGSTPWYSNFPNNSFVYQDNILLGYKGTTKTLTTYEVVPGTKVIGYGTFQSFSSLTDVTIPDSVRAISSYAFETSRALVTISPLTSVEYIGDCAFRYCQKLSSITFSNNLLTIGKEAFRVCYALTSIILPNSLISIGDSAFGNCTSLNSIILSENLTRLPSLVFSSCSALKSLVIPKNIKEIAFDSIRTAGLTTITLNSNVPPQLEEGTESNPEISNKVTTIYIPAGTLEAYSSADVWNKYVDRFVELSA